jgi:hypothetical protein
MSREDLEEFGDLILEQCSPEQQKQEEISELLDSIKKVRCLIMTSRSHFTRRRPPTAVNDRVRRVRILDVSQPPSPSLSLFYIYSPGQ